MLRWQTARPYQLGRFNLPGAGMYSWRLYWWATKLILQPQQFRAHLATGLLHCLIVGPHTRVSAPRNSLMLSLTCFPFHSYAPPEICDAIYGNIPGAQYVSALGQWSVPCDAE